MLEHAVETGENFANLFGVTSIGDSSKINLTHRYVISEVYKMLNLPSWKRVNDLIKQIEDETGVNIKSYDNKYHVNVRFGVAETSKSHKYSDAFIRLAQEGDRWSALQGGCRRNHRRWNRRVARPHMR